jgi:HEAT repeat protein
MTIQVDEATQRYTITDGGKPVLTYNFGVVPVPEGVGGKYAVARSNYVHPLYGPNGEILTKDYSPDHPHHRGFYWAWPEVTYKGDKRDLHALQGVFARPVKIVSRKAGEDFAELVAENVWKWGDAEPIVKETATIRVGPEQNGIRPIDFMFRFEALVAGVTVARRGQKAYGGFNLRMSARKDLKIIKHTAPSGAPHRAAWADAVGVPPGGKGPVGIFLLQSPANPEYPGDWVEYANLPWLQPTFPTAGTAYTLDPKAPLELSFRVIVRRGAGLAVSPEKLFAEYASTVPDPLAAMVGWRPGESRTKLTAIERGLQDASPQARAAFEQRLLALIADPKASSHFKAWSCKQFVVVGSDACIAAVTPVLREDVGWMQAADVLLSLPGDAAAATLRSALPSLPAPRRAALCHLLGLRRDAGAVGLLAKQAVDADAAVVAAAVEALGHIGTQQAIEALESLSAPGVHDALLRAAGQLAEGDGALAVGLYDRVWGDRNACPWHRAAALQGLAGLAPGKTVTRITQALSGDDRHLRNGAAAALRVLDAASLAQFRSAYAAAAPGLKLSLLSAWSDREVKAAEPEGLLALGDANLSVREAGIRALGRIGGGASVGPLLDVAAAGGVTGKEAETALTQMRGDVVDAALKKAVADGNEDRATAAVACLGARKPAGYLDTMLTVLKQGRKKTARSALTVLRNDGEADCLPMLIEPLRAEGTADRDGVAKAIVTICKRLDDPQKGLTAILDMQPLPGGEARDAMLSALPGIGGSAALAFVTRTKDEAAVRSLIKWPDGDGAEPLLAIAKDAGVDAGLRSLAAAGLVQYAKRVLKSADQRRVLTEALPHLTDEKQRAALRTYIGELSLVNLALNAAATSSRPSEAGHPPAHAVDGKKTIASYWGCTPPPCTLTLDLGRTEQIGRVRVTPYWDGRRFYRYRVESSVDGKAWHPVVDASENSKPATPEGVMHVFKPVDARHLRVVMLHNSVNPGLHIVELEIYAPTVQEDTP